MQTSVIAKVAEPPVLFFAKIPVKFRSVLVRGRMAEIANKQIKMINRLLNMELPNYIDNVSWTKCIRTFSQAFSISAKSKILVDTLYDKIR